MAFPSASAVSAAAPAAGSAFFTIVFAESALNISSSDVLSRTPVKGFFDLASFASSFASSTNGFSAKEFAAAAEAVADFSTTVVVAASAA